MAIQAPNENPPIQQPLALVLYDCIQSRAAVASLSSPWPLSNEPWLRPTPRKLKRSTEKLVAHKNVVKGIYDLVIHCSPVLWDGGEGQARPVRSAPCRAGNGLLDGLRVH